MKIETTTREVTDYRFTLTTDQLAAMLADPIAWADQLRAELNWQAPLDGTPAPVAKNGKGKGKPKGKAAAARKPPAGAALECGICQKKFKNQGWLNNHVAKAHPELAPSPESSPA